MNSVGDRNVVLNRNMLTLIECNTRTVVVRVLELAQEGQHRGAYSQAAAT